MSKPNYEYDKRRFETFVDAVIAIILTILVLELRVPETEHSESLNTRQLIERLFPSFLSYIASFLLIVGVWIDHHVLFLNVERVNKRYVLLNMLFLLFLSLIPFTTAFAGRYHHDVFAVSLLFFNYVAMNLSFSLLYSYGLFKKLIPTEFFTDNRATAKYSIAGIVGLIAAIPLAYVDTYISFALALIVFGGHLFKKK